MDIRRRQLLDTVRAPITRRFGLLAESIDFETNDPALLAAAEAALGRFPIPSEERAPLMLRLLADDFDVPGVGELSHRTDSDLYFVSNADSTAVADLRAGRAVGFVGRVTAANAATLRYAFVEGLTLAMLTYGRGYFALHASGVGRDGLGVAIHGREGTGKSTLALASVRRGLNVFAEDAVFVRVGTAGLEFSGLPWVQRLLPSAVDLFPELADIEIRRQPNGEEKLEIDLDVRYPGRTVTSAKPAAIVLLARATGGQTALYSVPRNGPKSVVEAQWPWAEEWSTAHARAAELLTDLPLFRLDMNEAPDEAVDAIERLLDDLSSQRPNG